MADETAPAATARAPAPAALRFARAFAVAVALVLAHAGFMPAGISGLGHALSGGSAGAGPALQTTRQAVPQRDLRLHVAADRAHSIDSISLGGADAVAPEAACRPQARDGHAGPCIRDLSIRAAASAGFDARAPPLGA